MKIPAFIRHIIKNQLLQTLPDYGYELVYVRGRNPLVRKIFEQGWITCNFCGTVFKRTEPNHSESLACPNCDSIARERMVYQCILDELCNRTGESYPYLRDATPLQNLTLLECSPRPNAARLAIYNQVLREYVASDFDMSAHSAGLKIDLTNDEDVATYANNFDIVICAHVLEHIPDYARALDSLYKMLAPDGLLILQVPLLESHYTEVTWDEFHQDNTRAYHRFAFDLLFKLDKVFPSVRPVVGLLDFEITSPEIKPDKYELLKGMRERCIILGEEYLTYLGLGAPDLCDAFIARK